MGWICVTSFMLTEYSVASMFGRSGPIDPNTLTGTGIYYCYASAPNMPLTGYGGMLIVCQASSDVFVQLMVVNKAPAAIYARRYTVEGWTQWGQV